jgi:hypothetical protein
MAKKKENEPPRDRPERGPHYSPEILFELQWYLTSYLLEAETALASARNNYETHPHIPGVAGALNYWESACSTIRWLLHRSSQRQKHLIGRPDRTTAQRKEAL